MNFNNEIREIINKRVQNDEFSGVVLIKHKDHEVFNEAYGYANRSWKIKNTRDTGFRIASISKMFTAVAVLQLIEKGKLKFDTGIVDYLNLYDTKIPKDVTVEHLLTHTSGIADYFDESLGSEEWERLWSAIPIYSIRKIRDYLPLFINKEPINKAGEKYNYSGAGYILLGLCIEKSSGESYFEYVKKNIFQRIGMKNSDFLSLDEVSENVAEGYEEVRDENNNIASWKRNIYTTTPEAASDGGATSTAEDLMKFLNVLKNNELLGENMSRLMLEPKILIANTPGNSSKVMYGYGNIIIVDNEKETVTRFGHTGEEYGVSCRLFSYPELDIDMAILSNQGMSAGALALELQKLLMNNRNLFNR